MKGGELAAGLSKLKSAWSDPGDYAAFVDVKLRAALQAVSAAVGVDDQHALVDTLGSLKQQGLISEEQHSQFIALMGDSILALALPKPMDDQKVGWVTKSDGLRQHSLRPLQRPHRGSKILSFCQIVTA